MYDLRVALILLITFIIIAYILQGFTKHEYKFENGIEYIKINNEWITVEQHMKEEHPEAYKIYMDLKKKGKDKNDS